MKKELELYFIINNLINEIDFNHPQEYKIITEKQVSLETKNGNYDPAIMLVSLIYIECLIRQSINQKNEFNKKLLWIRILELKSQADQEGDEFFSNIIYCLKNPLAQDHLKGKIVELFFQVIFN